MTSLVLPSSYRLNDEHLRRGKILQVESFSPWHNAKWEELLDLCSTNHRALSESAQEELIIRRIRGGDFKLFVQIVSEQRFDFDIVHDLIAAYFLDLIFMRNIQSLLSLGPRHGKSTLMCYLTCYLFGLNDGFNEQLYCAYGGDLSAKFGRMIRDTMSNPIFVNLFPGAALSKDAKAAKSFRTLNKGEFYASSVNGVLTGMGSGPQIMEAWPGGLYLDDPVKNMKEATSDVVMASTNQWVQSEFFTRGNLNHFKLITATRYSLQDVHETLLGGRKDDKSPYKNEYDPEKNPDGWRFLNIPTLCDNVETDPLLRTEIDQAAWESRVPAKKMITKRAVDPYTFSALYQGNPIPKSGSLFKRSFLSFVPKFPKLRYVFLSIDAAYGLEQDETVITVLGVPERTEDRNLYILDQIGSSLWQFPEMLQTTKQIFSIYKARNIIIEKAASGVSLAQSLSIQGNFPTELVAVTKSKVQRFSEVLTAFREEKIQLVDAEWNYKLIDQLTTFPFATHDDRVDSLVLGIWYWLIVLKGLPPDEGINRMDFELLVKEISPYEEHDLSWGTPLR
jgi:predicted phage terminase large subunit-like protein